MAADLRAQLAASEERLTAVEALVVTHEARDGRIPCQLLRVALGMPRRERNAS